MTFKTVCHYTLASLLRSGKHVDFLSIRTEVIRISRRRCQHDDDGDEPVLKEAHEGRVEGPVAGPQPRKGKNALSTQLLHQSTLGEDYGQDVSECG